MLFVLLLVLVVNLFYLKSSFSSKNDLSLYFFYNLFSNLFLLFPAIISTSEVFHSFKAFNSMNLDDPGIAKFQLFVVFHYFLFYLFSLFNIRSKLYFTHWEKKCTPMFLFLILFSIIFVNVIVNFENSMIRQVLFSKDISLTTARRAIEKNAYGPLHFLVYAICPIFYMANKNKGFAKTIFSLSLFLFLFLGVKFELVAFLLLVTILELKATLTIKKAILLPIFTVLTLFFITYLYNYGLVFNIHWFFLLSFPLMERLTSESLIFIHVLNSTSECILFQPIGLGEYIKTVYPFKEALHAESNPVSSVFAEFYVRFDLIGLYFSSAIFLFGVRVYSLLLSSIKSNSSYLNSIRVYLQFTVYYFFSGQLTRFGSIHFLVWGYFFLPFFLFYVFPIKYSPHRYWSAVISFVFFLYFFQGFIKGILLSLIT